MSCPSVSQCVAVGHYGPSTNGQIGLLLTDSVGFWSAASAPLPANAQTAYGTYTQGWVNGVSCPSAAQCVAVANYLATSGSGGLLLTRAG